MADAGGRTVQPPSAGSATIPGMADEDQSAPEPEPEIEPRPEDVAEQEADLGAVPPESEDEELAAMAGDTPAEDL